MLGIFKNFLNFRWNGIIHSAINASKHVIIAYIVPIFDPSAMTIFALFRNLVQFFF